MTRWATLKRQDGRGAPSFSRSPDRTPSPAAMGGQLPHNADTGSTTVPPCPRQLPGLPHKHRSVGAHRGDPPADAWRPGPAADRGDSACGRDTPATGDSGDSSLAVAQVAAPDGIDGDTVGTLEPCSSSDQPRLADSCVFMMHSCGQSFGPNRAWVWGYSSLPPQGFLLQTQGRCTRDFL